MPNSKYLADRLRAHARLYRHIAEETWNEDRAQELVRLADECTQAAETLAANPDDEARGVEPSRLHAPHADRHRE